jgi:hypothetical protein
MRRPIPSPLAALPAGRLAALAGLFAVFLLAAALGRPAVAADGEPEGIEAEIKARMEKIIGLMRASEKALLELSTGNGAKPAPVDVDPPDVPPGGAPPAGGEAGPGETAPPAPRPTTGEIVRKIEELVRGQREAARRIPTEFEELVRMIPEVPGGEGQGQGDPKSGEKPKPEARDTRKEMDDQPKPGETGEDPKSGEKDPKQPGDPEKRGPVPPDAEQPGGERAPNVPAWVVNLPPQIREAFERGAFEMVPEEYRELVERYRLWLLRQETREGGGR